MPTRIVYRPRDLGFDEFHEIDGECFPKEPWSREMFDESVGSDFWAATRGRRLIGILYLKPTPDVAWIGRVGVRSSDRNRGVGNLLMEAVLDHCRRAGWTDAMLYVMQDNPAAIHLYEKHGFRVAEESWQYVVPVDRFFESRTAGTRGRVTARPVVDLPAADRPTFVGQWSGLENQHEPPNSHVLVFFAEDGERVGHCRLSPGFPGCFPIEVADPAANLAGSLEALRPLLLAEHGILKLLIADPELAGTCRDLGFRLKLSLYKMTADLRD